MPFEKVVFVLVIWFAIDKFSSSKPNSKIVANVTLAGTLTLLKYITGGVWISNRLDDLAQDKTTLHYIFEAFYVPIEFAG